MNGCLDHPVVNWTCIDPSHLVTTIAQQSLDALLAPRQMVHRFHSPRGLTEYVQLGLFLRSIDSRTDLAQCCTQIASERRIFSRAFQLVFLDISISSSQWAIIESGAHYVFYQLSHLALILEQICDRLDVTRDGNHPLTYGLTRRLPWA